MSHSEKQNRPLKADELEQFAPVTDMELDFGIRDAVLALRAAGIETFESCEGGKGHAFPDPTIKFQGGPWAGYRAFAAAMERGLPVLRIQQVYGVSGNHLEGPWWEMIFHTTVKEK
jgi:hypothetical protein